MDNQHKKITDLASLRKEKERLRVLADKQQAVIKDDIAYATATLSPIELLNRLSTKIVPAAVRHSAVVNTPINFLAEVLFKKKSDVVDRRSDEGAGNRNRNIALGLAEGLGTWLLSKYVRRKMRRREDDED